MRKMFVFAPILIAFCFCSSASLSRTPRRFSINLDSPPRERWRPVLDVYKNNVIPRIAEMARSFVPRSLRSLVFGIFARLAYFLPEEYGEELRGIADYLEGTGITLGELVALNLLYDLTDFAYGPFSGIFGNRSDSLVPRLGCTSIVAATEDGRILHGRNFDYGMTPLLKDATILVDFERAGKVQYTALMFVLTVGVLTAQRPGAFTVSLNARYSGGPIDNLLMELLTRFHHPITFELRRTLEEAPDYVSALVRLKEVPMITPAYLIVGGKAGDGAIISRDRIGAADVYFLDYLHHRWFLLETNYDPWKPAGDERRKYGRKYMHAMGQQNLSPNAIFQRVLARQPILNDDTVYTTVMSAEEAELIYNYTTVWND